MKQHEQWISTFGNEAQLKEAINGEYLKGHSQPRVAFVGKSNVGKSSLLNVLTGQRLAQVSKQPGKTRLIHVYNWKQVGLLLVDLPGYGYAKASQSDRQSWADLIGAYLKYDSHLQAVLVLLDSRHNPSTQDEEAIDFFVTQGKKIVFILSKKDTLKNQSERAKREKFFKTWFAERFSDPEDVPVFWISSKTNDGISKLVHFLKEFVA